MSWLHLPNLWLTTGKRGAPRSEPGPGGAFASKQNSAAVPRTSVAACQGVPVFWGKSPGRGLLRCALLIALGVVFYGALTEAQADIRFVQQNYTVPQTPQSAATVNFTAAQTAGNLNIVAVGWNDATATVTSVTDSMGNTYQLAVGPTRFTSATDGGGNLSQSIYYAPNIQAAGAGANTVTVQFSQAAISPDIRIIEFSGLISASPVDVTAGVYGNSATASSGSKTTANAYDLIFAANMTHSYTSRPGPDFTNIVITDPDGDIAEYKTVFYTGSYSATAPLAAAGTWVMQMVAFKGIPPNPAVIGGWSTVLNPNNPTQPLLAPLNPVHAALLNNGKILVVAGSGNCPAIEKGCPPAPPYPYPAFVYDPVGRTFTQLPQSSVVTWDMFCNGAAALPGGQILFAGGTAQYDPFHGAPNAAIFDPVAGAFTNVAINMANGRWYPTLTSLANGQIAAFSGLDSTGVKTAFVEIYNPATSGWSPPIKGTYNPSLYPRMHVLPSGKVFNSGPTTTSRFVNPSSGTWSSVVATTNYRNARSYGTSVLLPLTPANGYDPQVMIMGGSNPATNTTEIIDLGATNPTWAWGPNMSQGRIEMNAVILPTGQILALGGSSVDESGAYASLNADLYDPASNTFSSAGGNQYPRLYHSVALLLPDATVWLAGGNPRRGTYQQQMEIYQPAYLFTPPAGGTRASIISAPASISVSALSMPGNMFQVQTAQAGYVASVVLVRMGAVTHAFNTDQRLVGLPFIPGSGVLNVTLPTNITSMPGLLPPAYYMLFLVDTSGVPSLAWIMQVQP